MLQKAEELIAIEVADDKVADSKILRKVIEKFPKRVQKFLVTGLMIDLALENIYLRNVYIVGLLREAVKLEFRNDSLQIIRNLENKERAFSDWKNLQAIPKKPC